MRFLDILPPTLQTVDLVASKVDSSLFARMPSLSCLTLSKCKITFQEDHTVPSTLTSLSFHLCTSDLKIVDFYHRLASPTLQSFSLAKHDASVPLGRDAALGIATLMPSQTSLQLVLSYLYGPSLPVAQVTSLPITITIIRLACNLPHLIDNFSLPIASLHCLTYLELNSFLFRNRLYLYSSKGSAGSHDAHYLSTSSGFVPNDLSGLSEWERDKWLPIDVLLLPRSLTTLRFPTYSIKTASKDVIDNLPPNLVLLTTRRIPLTLASEVCSTYPKLHLRLDEPIKVWISSNGRQLQKDFSELWSPVLDVVAIDSAVVQHYALRRVHFAIQHFLRESAIRGAQPDLPIFSNITTLITRFNSFPTVYRSGEHFPRPSFIVKAFPSLKSWRSRSLKNKT